MKEEIQREILERVDLLAEKIGATGGELFASYVTWVQVEPWSYLAASIVALIFSALGVFLFCYGLRLGKKDKIESGRDFSFEGDGFSVVGAVLAVTACLTFACLIGGFIKRIPNLYAPQKAAFEEFTKDLKQLK